MPPASSSAKPPIIRRIPQVQRGIFRNWAWDDGGNPFRRITLIYGTNGSGKSTLARLLADAAHQNLSSDDNLTVELGTFQAIRTDGDRKSEPVAFEADDARPVSAHAADDPLWRRLRVFNGDYVRANLEFDASRSRKPIIRLGQERIEVARRLEELDVELKKLDAQIKQDADNRDSNDRSLTTLHQRQGVEIKNAIAGHLHRAPWSTYNRASVRATLTEVRSATPPQATPEDHRILATKTALRPLSVPEPFSVNLAHLVERAHALCTEVPSMTVIERLRDHPSLAQWARQGLQLHTDEDSCAFCDGPLDNERRAALQGHFSDAYERLRSQLSAIDSAVAGYLTAETDAQAHLLSPDSAYSDVRADVEAWNDREKERLALLRSGLETVAAAVTQKLQQLDVIVQVPANIPDPGSSDAAGLQRIIQEHRTAIDDHDARREKAATRIAQSMVLAIDQSSRDLEDAIAEAETELAAAEEQRTAARAEREALVAAQSNAYDAAEDMTRDLADILGRKELEFAVSDDASGYAIRRADGSPAVNLSEGERTAIALVFFLAEVHRNSTSDHDTKDLIVVIDDPVSSLDSAIMLSASAFLWSRLVRERHVAQVIVMTHRFDFLRLWAERMQTKNQREKSQILDLRARPTITAAGTMRTPIFTAWPNDHRVSARLRSEYHYLFWCLIQAHSDCANVVADQLRDAEASWVAPNLARKLLERFIAFRAPKYMGNFTDGIKHLVEDQTELPRERADHVTKYLHSRSHAGGIPDESDLEPDLAYRYLDAALELLVAVDRQHVQATCAALDIDDVSVAFAPEEQVAA